MHELPAKPCEGSDASADIRRSLLQTRIGDIMEHSENSRVTYYRGNLRLREKLDGSEVKNNENK